MKSTKRNDGLKTKTTKKDKEIANIKMIYEGRVYESVEGEKSDIEEAKDIMYKNASMNSTILNLIAKMEPL